MKLIDADKLLEKIREQLINQLPSVDTWIPVSERLPGRPYGCLLTVEYENPVTLRIETFVSPIVGHWDQPNKTWHDYKGQTITERIVAWQPLPEPWRGEGK